MKATATRIGGISVRMALVCGSSVGQYELIYVQDPAILATIEGSYLLVKKRI